MIHKLKCGLFIFLFGILILLAPASAFSAGDETTVDIKEQQQNLQHLLDEIENVRSQSVQQKALLEKLSQKMQCNWALIKDYDECDKQYKEQPQKQLACVNMAKEKLKGCISEIGE